jgi:hypothetical protein
MWMNCVPGLPFQQRMKWWNELPAYWRKPQVSLYTGLYGVQTHLGVNISPWSAIRVGTKIIFATLQTKIILFFFRIFLPASSSRRGASFVFFCSPQRICGGFLYFCTSEVSTRSCGHLETGRVCHGLGRTRIRTRVQHVCHHQNTYGVNY